MEITEKDLATIFNKNNETYSRMIHLFLNEIYHKVLFVEDEKYAIDIQQISKLKMIERIWIEHETTECLNSYRCDQIINGHFTIENAISEHSAARHELFDYLCYEADLNDLKSFILSESVLNLEFFDYLALSIIGVSDQAKSEIAENLWDEAGHGNIKMFHTSLFKNLMRDLGLSYNRNKIIETTTWEGLAGINLFSYFAIYPYNKVKYLGLMSATEMLDPIHYHKLIKGISRITNKEKIDTRYYREHELIDIKHGTGWLEKVVFPELTKKPEKLTEFWLGFYMRLNSVKKYYDKLLKLFTQQQAA